jgi:tetratricopeptide (TPR) repeat protein
MVKSFLSLIACSLSLVLLSGCAGGVRDYIVTQRNAQGDRAMDGGNLKDAALAYRLALELNANDEHARTGLASVQTQLAVSEFEAGKLDDALASLAIAAKYDPQSVRIAELRAQIDQAKLKQSIVISNYPAYRETGVQLRHSYESLRQLDNAIIAALQRFDYTYDSDHLTDAIRQSYTLNEEVNRLTNRMVNYRELVESGAPQRGQTPLAPAASLLPLP